jgi:ABC-2 type transport system permease protein
MNTNIYLKELKRNRTAFLVWSVTIVVIISWGMFFYPIVMDDEIVKQLTTLFENPFMKGMMAAFGADLDKFSDILGFYATYNGMYFMMLASIYSIMTASRIVSKEEYERTADFLLTKPVTRIEVIASKIFVWATYMIALNLLMTAVAFIELELLKKQQTYSMKAFFVMSCYSFLGTFLFGALGLFLSILMKRGRNISSMMIGIVLGSYFIDAVSKITRQTHVIGFISPFKFVDHDVLRVGYGFGWWRLLYLIGLSGIFIGSSIMMYKKKDILI